MSARPEMTPQIDCDLLVIGPAGGINLGPAMTCGYIAGRHAAGVTGYEDARGIVRPEVHA